MFDFDGKEENLLLLETLFRHSPIGFALVDRDLRFVRVNAALGVITGMAESPVGRTVPELVPALWATLEPLFRRALDGVPVQGVELGGRLGQRRRAGDWLVSYLPLRRGSEVVGVAVVVEDITERKAIERALAIRNNLYAMLSRTHRAAARARSVEELYADACVIAVETGRFRFAWIGVPEGDRLAVVACAGTDNGYMTDLVISLDEADPRSQGPTGRAARTGQSFVVNDLLASPIMALWHDAARRAGFGAVAAFPLKERGRTVAVMTLYASEAGFFHDELRTTLSEMAPGISFALNKLLEERERLQEEKEHRRLEEHLRQAQKMEAVGRLAAGVAHDFNNLLTVINGYSDPGLVETFPEAALRESMIEIHKAGERAETLTRQLLSFSRRQVLEPKVLSLNTVVIETQKMLHRMLGEDILLATDLDPALGMVRADPGQISQILINLAVNARDAMPTGGQLSVVTANVTLDDAACVSLSGLSPGRHVVLSVEDTGSGMDDATKARLFEPFFTTKGVGKGTGLGLATVHGIVQQAHGHIAVESEVRRGTTFRVYLPSLPSTHDSTSPVPTLSMPPGVETILLVEDQEPVRALAARVLRGCGYTVVEAGDGREGLAVCEAHVGVLHLLVSDVVMPHLGGRELAERVRAIRPEIKVLFVSGYTDDALIHHGVQEAELAFLRKPFTPSELASKVRSVLNGGG